MSIYDHPKVLAAASHSVYSEGLSFTVLENSGFSLAFSAIDPMTGLAAAIWTNSETKELVVAYRGTDNPQDLYANIHYGRPQHDSAEFLGVINKIVGYTTDDGFQQVHFTGHSLGGALAQYAAVNIADQVNRREIIADITITTFNALGGLAGATDFVPGYSPELAETITGTHYRIVKDGVSLLGNGHIGGTVMILDKNAEHTFAAHSISNFTGYGNDNHWPADYSLAVVEENPQYLLIDNPVALAQLSSSVLRIFNNDPSAFTDVEAFGRVIVGIVPVIRAATDEEIRQLESAFFSEFHIDLVTLKREMSSYLEGAWAADLTVLYAHAA